MPAIMSAIANGTHGYCIVIVICDSAAL